MLATALLMLVFLPGAVAALLRPKTRAVRRTWIEHARRDADVYRCLDRQLTADTWIRPPYPEPGMEQIVADLRRLRREQLRGLCAESVRWQAAVQRAYDDRLAIASTALGVTQRLTTLAGMDRDLERLRVEEQLRAAGLRLH
ncbi:hypothetical protein L083_0520 [Actinoplanes sp. N902-109]|nr:hypothetical protein L083_0520 [Actinoplanes sp. N902-109]